VPALFFAPAHIAARRISEVTSQIDLPPTIMGIAGGDYRSAFLGRDVLDGRQQEPFAIVIYNKKRYGIVAEKELVVLSENGERLAYGRNSQEQSWGQVSMTASQATRTEDAVALLRAAEDLLISGRYSSSINPL
jgi:phosphoglycerol transferase MdoB-like AlkP superfamily enzyme